MMWPTQCERVLRVDISQLLNFWCELKNLSDSMTKEGKNWEGTTFYMYTLHHTAGSPPAGSPPAGSPPAGSPPAGSPPAGNPPAGSPPTGSPPAGSPPTGSSPAGSPVTGSSASASPVVVVLLFLSAPGPVSAPLFWDSVPADSSVSSATWLNTITLSRRASSLSLGSAGCEC